MPFVTDIYPPAGKTEAVAGLALALGGRKGKGFPGKRTFEAVEVLGRFFVPLRTVPWDRGEESCTGLVVDPQGLLTGPVRFDLSPGGPQVVLQEGMAEEDFINLCRQVAGAAGEFSAETMEIKGLIVEAEQTRPLLGNADANAPAAGLEQAVDAEQVAGLLRGKLAEFEAGAAAWAALKQQFLTYRDVRAEKIKASAGEAKEAGSKSLEELERQVKAAVAAKRQETEAERENARQAHQKERTLLQPELERFQQQFKETGEEYWRGKIKAEEQRLAESEKKLTAALEQLNKEEQKYIESQQERINQFMAAGEKRQAVFDQRLKLLNAALESLDKSVEKRLERLREQHKKTAALTVSLSAEQCNQELPVVFFAARYSSGRWAMFPPQVFGQRGVRGVLAGLVGGVNLPFRPASKVGEALAAKLQELIPGSPLEAMLVEQNLLKSEGFLGDARTGLAELIDQGEVSKKHANLFDEL